MEKQDVPKEKQFIESITAFFGTLLQLLFGCLIAFSFITAIALSYETGLIGWSIIGYKLMKIYLVVGVMFFIMFFYKSIVYKLNKIIDIKNNENNEKRNTFKKQLKKEIVKEISDGRSSRRR